VQGGAVLAVDQSLDGERVALLVETGDAEGELPLQAVLVLDLRRLRSESGHLEVCLVGAESSSFQLSST
jgi:hypothetical protein